MQYEETTGINIHKSKSKSKIHFFVVSSYCMRIEVLINTYAFVSTLYIAFTLQALFGQTLLSGSYDSQNQKNIYPGYICWSPF